MSEPIFVVKASGEREQFSREKLRRSLQKAEAPAKAIDDIPNHICAELKDGMTTAEIYRRAFSMLKHEGRHFAARYSLKRAIMELGPTGHPFEKLVGEMLKKEGYLSVEVGKMVQGACMMHEVDAVAEKDNRRIMVECKFHNTPGIKTDVKIALYVQARFEDIGKKWRLQPGRGSGLHEAWLVTNTKLTSDAITYALCVKMRAIGWSYPKEGNLQQLIERSHLHPVTSLTSLSRAQKTQLVDCGLILSTEIEKNRDLLKSVGINKAGFERILKEANNLCA